MISEAASLGDLISSIDIFPRSEARLLVALLGSAVSAGVAAQLRVKQPRSEWPSDRTEGRRGGTQAAPTMTYLPGAL